jgi:hypothetical protein
LIFVAVGGVIRVMRDVEGSKIRQVEVQVRRVCRRRE